MNKSQEIGISTRLSQLTKEYADISLSQDHKQIKGYIKFDLLHEGGMRKEINLINNVLVIKNMPQDYAAFYKKLMKYERQHKYKYTNDDNKKKYKTIFGVKVEILLPRKLKTNKDIKSFIHRFMEGINPCGYKLPYIAYLSSQGDGRYVRLLISEREYLDHDEYSKYDRNYRSKHGMLLHKKGDFKRDQDGKKIKEHVLFSKKVRIFVLDRSFSSLIDQLWREFLIALKKTIKHIEYRFILKIKKARTYWHYLNRKCVLEVNHAKRFIEYFSNYAVDFQRDTVIDSLYQDFTYKSPPPVPKYMELKSIFWKYSKRFDKGWFTGKDDVIRQISYRNVSLDILKKNIEVLIEEFKQEISSIVPGLFNISL